MKATLSGQPIVTLTMTMYEAGVLLNVFAYVGGSARTSGRGVCRDVINVLETAEVARVRGRVEGSIRFV